MKNLDNSSQSSMSNNRQKTFSGKNKNNYIIIVIKELENEDDPKTIYKNSASQVSLKVDTLSKDDSHTEKQDNSLFFKRKTENNDIIVTWNSGTLNENPKGTIKHFMQFSFFV